MGHLQRGECRATGAFKPDLTSPVRKVIDFAHIHVRTEFSNSNQTVKQVFAPPLSFSLCRHMTKGPATGLQDRTRHVVFKPDPTQ